MALESFPRFRNKDFTYHRHFTVPPRRSGRIDLVIGDLYGTAVAYKAIAAYSGIVNPTACRPGIRPDDEALRNELILRGVPLADIDRTVKEIGENREVGDADWTSYSDNDNGVISSVEAGTVLLVPEITEMTSWTTRYANLIEDPGDK